MCYNKNRKGGDKSPSIRREWIEMNTFSSRPAVRLCLPPYGGSGLKFFHLVRFVNYRKSPSIRREWIEMRCTKVKIEQGHKSPSIRREWIEIQHQLVNYNENASLPPYGGSGLKFQHGERGENCDVSPSIRREWIEIRSNFNVSYQCTSPSIRREWIEMSPLGSRFPCS